MIANIAYANKEDNGDSASGDGWKYRGRGIIQISFKRKYTNINRRIKDDYSEFGIVIDADNINYINQGTVASMAYWKEYKCGAEAKKGYGRKEFDAIVDIINKNTPSRENRWKNLKKCVDIFNVKDCNIDNPTISVSGQSEYYTYKTGKIKLIKGIEKKYAYYVEKNDGKFKLLFVLDENDSGMVKIPSSGNGFNRYGGIDAGGKNSGETVGVGDHYLIPKTAACLFGIINEINEKGWEIHLGDMSSENGSDPWENGFKHHAGHGHNGNRKGLDCDFRYLNFLGKSYHGNNTDSNFDKEKNKTFFKLAYKYGFRKNYCTNVNSVLGDISGVSSVSNHIDHGHIGLSDIDLEEITLVNVTKI